jgi:hypothetical protein
MRRYVLELPARAPALDRNRRTIAKTYGLKSPTSLGRRTAARANVSAGRGPPALPALRARVVEAVAVNR